MTGGGPTPWIGGTVWLGVGLNLPPHGWRWRRLRRALSTLPGLQIEAWSPIYVNAAAGARVRGRFWNAVVRARATVPPRELLARLKRLERRLGRRGAGDRPVDLDILWWRDDLGWRRLNGRYARPATVAARGVPRHGENRTQGVASGRLAAPALQLPHPRALRRRFVLEPLSALPGTPPAPAARAVEALLRRRS